MGIGLILSVAGLILLAPVGNDGQGLVTDPALRLDTAAVLLTVGIGLLLTSRSPLAFWLVFTLVGSIGYVSEQNSPWAPPGWHDRVVLISVVLFAAAMLLAAVPAPQTGGPALMLSALIGGILWLGQRFPSILPWSDGVQAFLVDAFSAVAAVVLALWLRHVKRSRAGFVLTVGGIAAFATEQVRPWAPAGWHDRILLIAMIAALIGVAAAVADYVVRESYGMVFVAGTSWGLAAMVAGHQQPWRARIDPAFAGLLGVVAAGLLVVAVTGLVCFAIQTLTELRRQYREDANGDETEGDLLSAFCTQLIVLSGGGFLLAATAFTTLRAYEQTGLGAFGLGLLVVAGLAAGFAGAGIVLVVAADHRDLTRPPQGLDELRAFVTRAVTVGPHALGPGPAVAYVGVALLLSCTVILNSAAAWFTLGLAGGALVVAGATMSMRTLLRGLGHQAAVHAGSVRLNASQIREQETLASRATAVGGGSVVLLFLVRAEAVPTTLRFVLSILMVLGLVLAAEAPVHLLVALQGKWDKVGWSDARRDPRLRSPGRVAVAGLVTSVAATVWVTSFDLEDWLRAVLTLAAIVGFCVLFGFGAFAIITVSETIRTGDRTLAHRAERVAVTQGNLYRLLPVPRRAATVPTPWDDEPELALWVDEDNLTPYGEGIEDILDTPPPFRIGRRDS